MSTPLTLATFNAENFYLLINPDLGREKLEALSEQDYQFMNRSIYNRNKDRNKISEIARIILEEDYDLVGLCEVGGMETLLAFNRLYLGDRYTPHLHEENSRRGIYVGALVKKGRFPHHTSRSLPEAFSRNLLRLDLGPEGEDLTIFVVHLKSQMGGDRGIDQRLREVQRLTALVPLEKSVVMGDFNGVLIPGEAQFEFMPFLELPLRDVLEDRGVAPETRRTHYYFGPGPQFNQLDYIFCTRDIQILEARVLEGLIPLNKAQREKLPSDHLFICARIGFEKDGVDLAKTKQSEGKWASFFSLRWRKLLSIK